MITKKRLKEIKDRFITAKAHNPMRMEGEHIKFEDDKCPIDCGWNVYSAKGSGIQAKDGNEYDVIYASNTTFEAACYLVNLPLDMAELIVEVEKLQILLGRLAADENDFEDRLDQAGRVHKDYEGQE